MNIEKYTERARGFIQSAQSLAVRDGHQQFSPLHLLKVLLDDSEGLAGGLIDRAGGNSARHPQGDRGRAEQAAESFRQRRRAGLSCAANWRAPSTPPKRPPRRPATALSRSSGCCWR